MDLHSIDGYLPRSPAAGRIHRPLYNVPLAPFTAVTRNFLPYILGLLDFAPHGSMPGMPASPVPEPVGHH